MPKSSSGITQSRKNKPLKRVSPHWRSTYPISLSQLQKKRDEFWDTAPAFEGRIEIWNALKVVADFFEKQDYDMAQAILDGACITLPTGTLCDCYDELGARYQLPLYVLSQPSNLISDHSTSDTQSMHSQQHQNNNNASPLLRNSNIIVHNTTHNNNGSSISSSANSSIIPSNQQCDYIRPGSNHTSNNNDICGCLSLFTSLCHRNSTTTNHNLRNRNRRTSTRWFQWNFNPCRRRVYNQSMCGGFITSTTTTDVNSSTLLSPTAAASSSSPSSNCLNLRLSTGEQFTLEIDNENMTILEIKRLFAALCGWHELRQRWFVYGRCLPNKLLLKECYIPKGFIIQVIVHSPFDPECLWKRGNNNSNDNNNNNNTGDNNKPTTSNTSTDEVISTS
uniref:Ubiquitin-like domain-containing protein n=1 Tax=Trichobilharzia regenti TaxID=157069 RepID=A0AA85KKZ9_TRIRE|nr:unnamed protein product [Trichobilharzia regenti]